MFEEGFHGGKFRHGVGKLCQIVQPSCRFRRFIGLPHAGVTGFIEDDFRDLNMAGAFQTATPALDILRQLP